MAAREFEHPKYDRLGRRVRSTPDGGGPVLSVVMPSDLPAGDWVVVWHPTVGAHVGAGEPLIVAQGNIGRVEVRANVAGRTHQVFVNVGDSLSASQPLADIELDKLYEQAGPVAATVCQVTEPREARMQAAHVDNDKPFWLGFRTMDHKTALSLVGAIVIVGSLGWILGLAAFFVYGGTAAPLVSAVSLAAVTLSVWWGKSHVAAMESSA